MTDAEPELEALQASLADWEMCYITTRPHQALGYLTPPRSGRRGRQRSHCDVAARHHLSTDSWLWGG
ncbi:MAG: integrase core domain-containing protein [Candidatus Limnocylindrales bacterium]